MYSLLLKNAIRDFLKQRKIEDESEISDCVDYWDDSARKFYKIIEFDIDNLIQFMEQDCLEEEFMFICENAPELAEISKSKEFVASLYRLADKFSQTTKKWNLMLDIEDAESALDEE